MRIHIKQQWALELWKVRVSLKSICVSTTVCNLIKNMSVTLSASTCANERFLCVYVCLVFSVCVCMCICVCACVFYYNAYNGATIKQRRDYEWGAYILGRITKRHCKNVMCVCEYLLTTQSSTLPPRRILRDCEKLAYFWVQIGSLCADLPFGFKLSVWNWAKSAEFDRRFAPKVQNRAVSRHKEVRKVHRSPHRPNVCVNSESELKYC